MKLWQKNSSSLHPFIEKFTVGDDIVYDSILLSYDILGTIAHAKALEKIGILTKTELEKIIMSLKKLQKMHQQKKVKITLEDEDCHTLIENYLSEKIGDIGKKIHIGRSRNDQSLTALRLYTKSQLKIIRAKALKVSQSLYDFAKKNSDVIFPGYSHGLKAMPTTLGHYILAFVESLIDDLQLLGFVSGHIDKNPLGSAAGFGTSLNIDRALTTQELEFKQIQINSLYCQNSRGKFESAVMEILVQIMLTIGKLAGDMILFTSGEFDFFEVDYNLTTGSSIMPQKCNLDLLEIIRGNASVIIGNQHIIQNIGQKILSGYNRDFQLIKKPFIDSLKITDDCLEAINIFIKGIIPKPLNIEEKMNIEMLAADLATSTAVKKKIPFRDTYKTTLKNLKISPADKKNAFKEAVKNRISLGGPGNPNFDFYQKTLRFPKQ